MLRRFMLGLSAMVLAVPFALVAQASGQPPQPSLGNWVPEKKAKPRDPNIRALKGQISLPDGEPAEGAVVKIKNLKTLQVRSYITQKDGKYQFQNLSTNVDYEVKSDFKDMSSPSKTLSVFDSRLDPVLNLKLEPSKDKKDDKSD